MTLPQGGYRFRADKNGEQYWSGEVNHCAVPGCAGAAITTTIPVVVTVEDGAGDFSPVEEADLDAERIGAQPTSLFFLAEYDGLSPRPRALAVEREGCDPFTWSVSDDAAWLQTHSVGETIEASVDITGLVTDTYYATINIEAEKKVLGSPVQTPVTLIVANEIYHVYLPIVARE